MAACRLPNPSAGSPERHPHRSTVGTTPQPRIQEKRRAQFGSRAHLPAAAPTSNAAPATRQKSAPDTLWRVIVYGHALPRAYVHFQVRKSPGAPTSATRFAA
ncbi:hypothetical protein NDU88_005064 [Pleurodeles waltl]|uniref:Uncharacterized protein n=1 Tax=Pleurodeles waltl TaxID=8319 RepID=A0AAV7L212_PLEWA|nr:hypothetical protein NDU88_005064 [Pleurodeles waltl]